MAVAAALLLAIGSFWRTPSALADMYVDAANAGAAWFRLVGSVAFVLDLDSPEGRARFADLERRRLERDRLREFVADKSKDNLTPFCLAWQAYYCDLRDLGVRDAAIREVEAAVEFARSQERPKWLSIFLDGKANVYLAFGEYATAREAYEESIRLRRADDNTSWPEDPHYGEPGYEGHMAWGIAPMYLRLMRLEMAEGNLIGAREQFAAAERAMAQRIRTTCELNGVQLPLPPGAGRGEGRAGQSMWELWQALPHEFREPKHHYTADELKAWSALYAPDVSLPAWVRTVLYHEALLLRAEEDYAGAQLALDRAGQVPDYPDSGEFPLPFLEGLEAARLAIARKEYAAALRSVKAARAFILRGPGQATAVRPPVNELPLKPLQSAELDALEATALLATNPNDPRGRELIHRAVRVVKKLASGMPEARREAFMKQFEPWQKLADEVVRRSNR
ncbi:MAG: hypothetical protein L6Q92_01945 [Phycisphaerae bacterium]|nr:hypothetical protein [Phycisphaerae bacterium]